MSKITLNLNYKVNNTAYNKAVFKLTIELLKQLEGAPLDRINLYYYIEELHSLKLKYNK